MQDVTEELDSCQKHCAHWHDRGIRKQISGSCLRCFRSLSDFWRWFEVRGLKSSSSAGSLAWRAFFCRGRAPLLNKKWGRKILQMCSISTHCRHRRSENGNEFVWGKSLGVHTRQCLCLCPFRRKRSTQWWMCRRQRKHSAGANAFPPKWKSSLKKHLWFWARNARLQRATINTATTNSAQYRRNQPAWLLLQAC